MRVARKDGNTGRTSEIGYNLIRGSGADSGQEQNSFWPPHFSGMIRRASASRQSFHKVVAEPST
jgi:hypothetical protein